MDHAAPAQHPDPWVNILRGYVTHAVSALTAGGLRVERSWLDPRNPRDATIIFTDPTSHVSAKELALVWDEVTGWRRGVFESGQQGVRTVLTDTVYLGGGMLPDGQELAGQILAEATAPRCVYRSASSSRDGLDEALRARN